MQKKACVTVTRLRRETRRLWYESVKKQYHCIICKTKDFRVLEFHHRDPATKIGNVGQMITAYPKIKVLEEIQKCDCLCSNCHKILHYEEKQKLPLGKKNIGQGIKKNLNNIQLDV
jgi:hypothetical protein